MNHAHTVAAKHPFRKAGRDGVYKVALLVFKLASAFQERVHRRLENQRDEVMVAVDIRESETSQEVAPGDGKKPIGNGISHAE